MSGSSGGGYGALFILAAIVFAVVIAIAAVIYVVLPASALTIIGISAVGLLSGAVVAVRNFSELLIEAHKNEK